MSKRTQVLWLVAFAVWNVLALGYLWVMTR